MSNEHSYVRKKNVSKLIQWLTSELVKDEPENPIKFIHNLTGQVKFQEYSSDQVDDLLADSIKGIKDRGAPPQDPGLDSELERITEALQRISLLPKGEQSMLNIMQEMCSYCGFAMAHLYTVHSDKRTCIFESEEKKYEVAFGEGVIGKVAESGNTLRLSSPDICDPVATAMGLDVRSTVICPLKSESGEVIAILQMINKNQDEPFTVRDELYASLFCTQILACFLCTQFDSNYNEIEMSVSNQFHAVVDLIGAIQHAEENRSPLSSLIFTITRRTLQIVECDRCTLFVCDPVAKQMWSMQGEINICIPIDKGIAGSCATKGEIIKIDEAYEDDRFNPAFDKKSGYRTRTILCMPMKSNDEVIAVLQLINKNNGLFTTDDQNLLSLVLDKAAKVVDNLRKFHKNPAQREMPCEMKSPCKNLRKSSADSLKCPMLPLIEEGNEEM